MPAVAVTSSVGGLAVAITAAPVAAVVTLHSWSKCSYSTSVEFRVEQLAAAADVSVDTIRFYQARGLLPAPRRAGRVAWYGEEHLLRLQKIRSLQRQGLTLAAIRRVLERRRRADRELAAAVFSAQGIGDEEDVLTVEELARRSGVAAPLLRALERAGVELGRRIDGHIRYTAADVEMVSHALRLLDVGLPLPELLALARDHHAAVRATAERAVALFDDHVRTPIRERAGTDEEAAEQLVAAFRTLLPAVTSLVAHHFRRVLLTVAEEHLQRVGAAAEVARARAEASRPLEARSA